MFFIWELKFAQIFFCVKIKNNRENNFPVLKLFSLSIYVTEEI